MDTKVIEIRDGIIGSAIGHEEGKRARNWVAVVKHNGDLVDYLQPVKGNKTAYRINEYFIVSAIIEYGYENYVSARSPKIERKAYAMILKCGKTYFERTELFDSAAWAFAEGLKELETRTKNDKGKLIEQEIREQEDKVSALRVALREAESRLNKLYVQKNG